MAFKEKRREERYRVEMTCTLPDNEEMEVLDISRHGLSLFGTVSLVSGEPIDINVNADGAILPIRAMIVNMTEIGDKIRYGLEIISHPEQWLDIIYTKMMNNR